MQILLHEHTAAIEWYEDVPAWEWTLRTPDPRSQHKQRCFNFVSLHLKSFWNTSMNHTYKHSLARLLHWVEKCVLVLWMNYWIIFLCILRYSETKNCIIARNFNLKLQLSICETAMSLHFTNPETTGPLIFLKLLLERAFQWICCLNWMYGCKQAFFFRRPTIFPINVCFVTLKVMLTLASLDMEGCGELTWMESPVITSH